MAKSIKQSTEERMSQVPIVSDDVDEDTRNRIKEAYDAADKGNYALGIELGLFPEDLLV